MRFVWMHVVWFTAWLALNSWPGLHHLDPYPFTFLTMVVSLEAIFLSTFVLISQNEETRLSERRNAPTLQIDRIRNGEDRPATASP